MTDILQIKLRFSVESRFLTYLQQRSPTLKIYDRVSNHLDIVCLFHLMQVRVITHRALMHSKYTFRVLVTISSPIRCRRHRVVQIRTFLVLDNFPYTHY